MDIEVLPDAGAVARRAAALIAAEARAAVAARGGFVFAVSGGSTPWVMLRALAAEQVPWESVHLFQVDERVAPPGHDDRNLTHVRQSLAGDPRLARLDVRAMPVEDADLGAAAARYAEALRSVAGSPPTLDLIHLGLGADGHTASLVPGDPVLQVADADVALAGPYQGRQRMTLTYPVLDRARRLLWVVTGAGKAAVVPRLLAGDGSIPAGRVRADRALLLVDAAAASALAPRP
ncbi:6-phosphogluconolactonase [Anaeromyxobacter oryzae]|uniref:6-phosphogluconolactonase n=1 Tax=Anaeromyxobacter oryzae TaxID=2918170 RepID=A0ABN6MRS5_9BACT|nr:6-phosphogluconolactonase [Anaeromyxobacter oryzae]BDG02340.1 6-phosphogluconolactonase [Anaeromyxobacter oryzae]